LSVLHANGASPFTRWASATSTSQPWASSVFVHEPSAVHRLNDRSHPARMLRRDALGQAVQAVLIERRSELVDELALIGDQADVDALAAEIQPNMQHDV
jgi:hypothetical protein